MIQTIDDNKSHYAKADIERADRAKHLISVMGFPSVAEAIKIMNRGKNFDINPTDFNLAQRIYGDTTAILKGKTVKRKTNSADMTIASKTQLVSQILALDIMYMDKVGILVGLAYPLDHTLATRSYHQTARRLGQRQPSGEETTFLSGHYHRKATK